jgi:Bifunctional DNA primase/polymerase, N-terminal
VSAPTVTLSIPELADDIDTLTAALFLAANGIYVGPAIRGTKNPGSILGKGWQHKTSRDPKQIAAWFAGTDHDLFIHCGRSGLVVLDVDDPDELPSDPDKLPGDWRCHLDAAPYQPTRPDTPGRGHYVFAMPASRAIGNPAYPWGEVRGLNGVIMVFPSHHKDGGRYGPWQRRGVVPVLPDEIAQTFPDAPTVTDPVTGAVTSAAVDAATDAQVDAFLAEHTDASRPEILAGWPKALTNKFAAKLSRHMSTLSVLTGAMKEARAGYFSAMAGYDVIRPMFLEAVAKPPASDKQNAPRNGQVASLEFYGILAWAVAQANAADLDEVRERTEAKMPDHVHVVDAKCARRYRNHYRPRFTKIGHP